MIEILMPSPVGHLLAGIAVAWGSDLAPATPPTHAYSAESSWYERAGGSTALTCALLAAAPDVDLAFGVHRTVTHSLTAMVVVALVAGVLAARSGGPALRMALVCGAAWGSHLLMDWLGVDERAPRGIQLLWPFSHAWFISGWDVFAGTERNHLLTMGSLLQNVLAIGQEVAILTPILLLLWLVRIKTLTGFSTELSRSHHPTK